MYVVVGFLWEDRFSIWEGGLSFLRGYVEGGGMLGSFIGESIYQLINGLNC